MTLSGLFVPVSTSDLTITLTICTNLKILNLCPGVEPDFAQKPVYTVKSCLYAIYKLGLEKYFQTGSATQLLPKQNLFNDK